MASLWNYGRFANKSFCQRSVRQRLESIHQHLESIRQCILPTELYCITLLYTIIYCHIKGSVILLHLLCKHLWSCHFAICSQIRCSVPPILQHCRQYCNVHALIVIAPSKLQLELASSNCIYFNLLNSIFSWHIFADKNTGKQLILLCSIFISKNLLGKY